MEKKLAAFFTDWSCKYHVLSMEEQSILCYGVELILNSLLKTLALGFLGVLTHTLKETCLFLLVFCSYRSFAGGFHRKTSLGCFLSMCMAWFCGVKLSPMLASLHRLPLVFLLAVLYGIVCRYVPSDTSNNPIRDPQLRKRKKRGAQLLFLLFSLSALRM